VRILEFIRNAGIGNMPMLVVKGQSLTRKFPESVGADLKACEWHGFACPIISTGDILEKELTPRLDTIARVFKALVVKLTTWV
jgi:hypothetical protein